MWYKELGYSSPGEYFTDPTRFVAAATIKFPMLVRISVDSMCGEDGIPRIGDMRCCRSCGRMTLSTVTCSECGSPV